MMQSTCEPRLIHADCSTKWIRAFSRVEKNRTNPESHWFFGACENIAEHQNTQEEMKKALEKKDCAWNAS